MSTQNALTQLKEFRQQVYTLFPERADALMDLLDALSGNTRARSVIELSLNSPFRRGYSSVPDSIDNFFRATDLEQASVERRVQDKALLRLIARQLTPPVQRKFWLFGLDTTPQPRPFADTLGDRTYVYQPNGVIKGNKPVTIGHEYSVLANFPEKAQAAPPWVVPLWIRRVASTENKLAVGAEQIQALLTDTTLPFHLKLCVEVEDSAYSVAPFLGRVAHHANLVTVTRLRGNRKLYRQAAGPVADAQGHPVWYGEPFALKDPTTWGKPEVTAQTTYTGQRGRTFTVQLEGWYNLLMCGAKDLPMHPHPFTVIRVRVLDEQGQLISPRPMWLIVFGARRHELSLLDAWQAYSQRYDIEHFFRLGKQRLLTTAFQTPVTEHEENWWQIGQLAYVQLWVARSLSSALPRPWERYLPSTPAAEATPSAVQRDWERITRHAKRGTPAAAPKPRGKSAGRAKGARPPRRKRCPVIKKSATKRQKQAQRT
jgi:hypothetical protein